ncbi:TolC family protein [Fibrobacterota bacterium]
MVVFSIKAGFLVSGILAVTSAFTEQEAVRLALKANPDIKISSITLRRDSLELEKARDEGSLQAILTGDKLLKVNPRTSLSYGETEETRSTVETALGADLSRQVTGGGSIKASAESRGRRDLDSSESVYSATAALTVTQPLLKDAWSNAPVDHQIELEKKNLRISFESFKNNMLDILSRVRDSYLDWLSAVNAVEIRKAELEYTRNSLEYEKARFQLGEKAEMDTLTAALEFLRARENFMSAEYEQRTAKKRFALELGIEKENLPELSDAAIQINPIPSAEDIMAKVRENHFQLRVLDITRESLLLQKKKHQNALLPRVDVSAGITATRTGDGMFSSGAATATEPDITDPWIGITFSYDLLSRRDRRLKKQAELSLMSNEIEKENLIREQTVAVAEFVDAWAEDSAKLDIRSAEADIAEKNFSYAVERYKLGEIDNLARLKARSDLINARLNKLFAEVNLKRLEIAVDRAAASVLDRFGVKLK